MAELLVSAKKHWMDDLSIEEVEKMTSTNKESYDARSQIGDIIVVKPDGWVWGREECLPTFIVVKLPGVTIEEVEHLTQMLVDTTILEHPKILKRRKYQIPKSYVDDAKTAVNSVVTISQSKNFTDSITEKVKS